MHIMTLADTRSQPHRPQALSAEALAMQPIAGEHWDETIAQFDGAVQEQLYRFAKARWPGTQPQAWLFANDGAVVGGVLVLLQPLPLRLGQIAVVKWGPVLADATRPDAQALYQAMIEALVGEYARKRGMMLSVLPRAAVTPVNTQFEHLLARGFKAGSQLLFPNRYLVRLGLSDADQRKSFEQKWRYHLNKADKAGLSFAHAPASALPEFTRLYQAMTDRKKFPDHSAFDSIETLMTTPVDGLRPQLFFVREGEETVAGAIVFTAGDTAVYLYGATNERALPLRAGYFLHRHIISWLRDNTDAQWYDLGGTDGFQGLHQFKKGMVGSAGVIAPVPPVANFAARPLPFLLGTGAFAARDALHGALRWIDRHRPDRAKPDQEQGGARGIAS